MCRGGIHLVSVYLWNGEGLSKRNLDLLHCLAQVLTTLDGPWILGGDFNLTPELLGECGWLQLARGVAFAPDLPTCNEKVYDFFVVSEGLAPAVFCVRTLEDGGFNPHSPVRMLLHARPRRFRVRQLAAPKKF